MSSSSPSDPYLGAFLGLACGDALGAPVEFLKKEQVEARHGRLTEMVGGGSYQWAPGEWTDDTGMALAVAEGILADPEDPVAPVGEGFLRWVKTAKDVGGTISAALQNADEQEGRHRGRPLQDDPKDPSHINWAQASRTTPEAKIGRAAGNGSLMRTLPVALAYPEVGTMLDVSARISAMTHWDPQAELCCAIYCLWVREILFGTEPLVAWRTALELGREVADEGQRSSNTPGPTPLPDSFWPRLEAAPDQRLEDLQPTGYAGYVLDCLEAAVWTPIHSPSLEEALVTLVNLGGETDTMAAVAGGAVGAQHGIQEVPSRWLQALHQCERVERAAQGLFDLRHQLTYRKPSLPEFRYKRLDNGLLYGRNPLSAKDAETLIEAGVTTVLDLREDHEWTREDRFGRDAVAALERSPVDRINVSIVDTKAPTTGHFDRTWQLLSEGLATGTVYVHCRAGVERTGAVITAYLARRDGRSLHETLQLLEKARSGLHPLPHQIEAVRRWLDAVS